MAGTCFDLVTLDALDTEAQARFWAAATNLVEVEREDGNRWIVLGEHTANGMLRRLGIQRVGVRRPSGPMHLDLVCPLASFEEEVVRLVSLGANVLRPARPEPYGRIANLADPEGNPFDLCSYREH